MTFLKCLFPVLFLAIAALGQDTLSLRGAVDQALKQSPLLRASVEQVQLTSGLLEQAGTWANPRFVFQTENLRSSNFDFGSQADTYAYLVQPFSLPGKRGARVAVARSTYRQAELQGRRTRREIAVRVKRAYWRAVATERTRQLLRENVADMQSLVTYHEARVQEGAMAEADLLRVQLERERFEVEATTATLEAERALIELFREMGATEVRPVRLEDSLEAVDAPAVEVSIDSALAHREEVLEAKAALERALANERLQRATARPDFDVVAGYKRWDGLNTGVLGLALNLPVFDRNTGNIKASTAEVRQSEALLASAEATVRAEVAAAAADYEARRRQVSTTLRLIRGHATETASIARAAYREGGIDLLRLIDSERMRIDSELLYCRALFEYQQSLANLENALGVSQ